VDPDLPPGLVVRAGRLAPGVMGLWHQPSRTVWLDSRLVGPERRCTLVHELVHAERGDVPCDDEVLEARQERRVEREAARRLVGLGALAEALRWSEDVREVAEILDVDTATLDMRIESLTTDDRRSLRAVLGADLVDPVGELDVELGDSTLGVRRQREGQPGPSNVDVRVVVHLLGDLGYVGHDADGIGER